MISIYKSIYSKVNYFKRFLFIVVVIVILSLPMVVRNVENNNRISTEENHIQILNKDLPVVTNGSVVLSDSNAGVYKGLFDSARQIDPTISKNVMISLSYQHQGLLMKTKFQK